MIYDLFFTGERIVAVIIRSPNDVRPSSEWWTSITGNWFTMHQEEQERTRIARERRLQTESIDLDQILASNRSNFQIRYEDISSVEIKHSLLQDQLRFHLENKDNKRSTVSFHLKKEQVPVAKMVIEKMLRTKIKTI